MQNGVGVCGYGGRNSGCIVIFDVFKKFAFEIRLYKFRDKGRKLIYFKYKLRLF